METEHIVGEFLTGSIEKAHALEEQVGKIAALNPRMNADQLRSLEAELVGIVRANQRRQ